VRAQAEPGPKSGVRDERIAALVCAAFELHLIVASPSGDTVAVWSLLFRKKPTPRSQSNGFRSIC